MRYSRRGILGWTFVTIFIICRIFIYDYNMVPSCSMTPTLNTGDILFVEKFTYEWNRMSIPFGGYLPFWKDGYKFGSPTRGTPVVFIASRDPATYYVKRIVGLPGDKVQMKDGILHINGQACLMEKVCDYEYINDRGKKEKGEKYKVTMPCGKSYYVYRNKPFGKGHIDNTPEFTVPENHVWVQGDYHTGSVDSFSPHFLGPVPIENLAGTPKFVFYGTNDRSENAANMFIWIFQLPLRMVRSILKTNFSRCGVIVE